MKYIKTMDIRALARGIARGLPSHVVRARHLLQLCLEPQQSSQSLQQQPPHYVQVVSAGSGEKICTVTIPTDATMSLRCFLGSALFEHGLSQPGYTISECSTTPQLQRTTWSFCCLISDRHGGNSIDLTQPANTFCLPEIVVHRYSQEWICAWKTPNGRSKWRMENTNPTARREMGIAEVIRTKNADYFYFSWVTLDFKDDREIMELAVLVNPLRLRWVSAWLRNDREFVMKAIQQNGEVFEWVSEELRNDRDIATAAAVSFAPSFAHASDSLRKDKQFVIELCAKTKGYIMTHVDPSLLDDEDVAMAAVRQNITHFRLFSERVRSQKSVVMFVVQHQGMMLQFAGGAVRDDFDIVMAAVQSSGCALKFTSLEMQTKRELVLAAVQQDGSALQFANPSLRYDHEIVKAAVASSLHAFRYAYSGLRGKPWLAAGCPQFNIRTDREIALIAVRCHGYDALLQIDKTLHNDSEIRQALDDYKKI